VQDNSHESKHNSGGRSTRQRQKKRITIVRPEDSFIFVTFRQSGRSSGRRPSLLVQQQGRAEGGATGEGRGRCKKGGPRSEQCKGRWRCMGAARVAWGFFKVNLVGLGSGQPAHSAQILS
jgi:hypothetical protein